MTNYILNQLTFLVYGDTQWTQVLMAPVNGQIKKALERFLFSDSHPGKTDCHLLSRILSFVHVVPKSNTSTRASFFSSLFAVAKIALIAFAVISSPESDVTGQVPRYFTFFIYGTGP